MVDPSGNDHEAAPGSVAGPAERSAVHPAERADDPRLLDISVAALRLSGTFAIPAGPGRLSHPLRRPGQFHQAAVRHGAVSFPWCLRADCLAGLAASGG